MSPDTVAELTAADQEYAEIWCKSTVGVLESLQAVPFAGTCQPGKPATEPAVPDSILALLFKVSGPIAGEQSFLIAKPDAVRLAQLLMSEPLDASVVFADTHTDALHEIFRQFAGLAASSCKGKYGGEVQFELVGAAPAEWKASGSITAVFAAPQIPPIQWTLRFGSELHAVLSVLEAAREAKPATSLPAEALPSGAVDFRPTPPATPATPSPAAPKTKPAPAPTSQPVAAPLPADTPANLDLLLDIELDASLRFGRREMILRDILSLRPGSVVELDRQIQEPAELLIAGRVVARGEVVIVDGSYGLRITEIEQPHQRLVSLET